MRKRIFVILLLVILLMNDFIPARAEEKKQICYISAYSSSLKKDFVLPILNYNDEAYIKVSQAASLAGMEYTEKNNKYVFIKRYHEIEVPQNKAKKYEDDFYLPLKEIMNDLQVTYICNEKGQLIFMDCSAFVENLEMEVIDILNGTNNTPSFSMGYLENTWGIGLAAIYNIISNLRVDYLWGGYQKEQYTTVIANLMLNEKNDIIELASDGEQALGDLLKVGKLDGSLDRREFFGYPYDDYLQAYDIIDNMIPGLSIEEGIRIAQNINVSLHASELYVNGVKYALVNNLNVKGNLKKGVKTVYNYYDKNKSTMSAVLTEIKENIIDWSFEESFELTTDCFGINSIWVQATEFLFRKLGVNEKMDAAEQTLTCAEIQEISKKVVLEALSKNRDDRDFDDIMTIKYGTILYLRACQYAYSLYSFEPELLGACNYWKEKTDEKIATLAAYDDKELTLLVKNQSIDINLLSNDYGEVLLQNKLNSLLKEIVSTQSFLTSSGIDIYSYPKSIRGVTNAVILDVDQDGEDEIIAIYYDNNDIILKKYYINNDHIQEDVLGILGELGYCDNIGILLYYNSILKSYCIAINDICVGAYTGVHAFTSKLYTIYSDKVVQQKYWDWNNLIFGWEGLESIQNEMLSIGWPYMNNYYLEFYNDQITSDYIQLMGTEVEITDGEFPPEYVRYMHFLSLEEMPSLYF